jgi:hypothetical protein
VEYGSEAFTRRVPAVMEENFSFAEHAKFPMVHSDGVEGKGN